MLVCYKVISITWLSRAHTPVCYYRFYIFKFLAYEVSCLVSSLVTLKSRLGLEAMMSRLGLGRFDSRSSSVVNRSRTKILQTNIKKMKNTHTTKRIS